MSSVDTKWKKKIKGINNKEGLDNKDGNTQLNRVEKDEAQNKMLDELKNRLRTIQNERSGFTKLPHLTDIKEESDNKEEFKEGAKNDDKVEFKEGADIPDVKVESNADAGSAMYPHGLLFGISYIVFLFIYLQLYHLNFKEDIKSNFPKDYETEDTPAHSPDEIPREWSAITENILDSLKKSLSFPLAKKINGGYGFNPDYTDIKHNNFLKYMNNIAQFDGGVFLRYLFIPAQVIIAVTQNLIPNLKLIPGINKFTFPLIFVFLFFVFYGATFTNKIGGVSEIRNYADNKKWEGWDWFVKYYTFIPISYFVIVGIIIIGAFILDAVKQLVDGSYFKDGLIAAVAKFLFSIISISMSIVLSGFSAIPLGFFAARWILFPEGGWPPGEYADRKGSVVDFFHFTKWSNAIRDNYLLPEWDVCEVSKFTQWARYITRKLWNYKILISFLIVLDIVTKLYFGNGVLQHGKEDLNENWWVHILRVFIIIVILVMMSLIPTTRDTGILCGYIKLLWEKIKKSWSEDQPTATNQQQPTTATTNQ